MVYVKNYETVMKLWLHLLTSCR